MSSVMKDAFFAIRVLLLCSFALSSSALTITVTDIADSGPGTLRQAILDANATALPDAVTIEFNLAGGGVQTIAPLTALPAITRPVTIDGYTQPGASPNTLENADNAVLLVELNGMNLPSDYGLRFNADDCRVRGMVINRFAAQVLFENATNGVVEGNFLGPDATGTNLLANSVNGVLITGGAGHRVGGLTPAARNVISGDSYVGINAGTCSGLQILGNFIGLGADGLTAMGAGWGINLSACTGAQIGAAAPGARNVIGGHNSGCWIVQGGNNLIQGNFIGTDPTGTLRRTNVYGLVLQNTTNNLVGGNGGAERNLLSGNQTAINLDGVGSSNNVITGNFIGPDITGTNVLGQDYYGISIVSAPNNTIGGLTPGARNVIYGNGYAGIALSYATATGNVIQGNYIGVDVTGTNGLPGTGVGVAGYDATGNRIGGTAPGAGNVISHNFQGIAFTSGSNNVIQGNFIGTDATGTRGLGNSQHGIVQDAAAAGTLIGGTTAGAGNVIAANGYDGISSASPETVVQGNTIGADVTGTNALFNGWSAIELAATAGFTQVGGTNPASRNIISGNSGIGVYSSSNVIQGNYLGIGRDGSTVVGVPGFGISVVSGSQGNLLGGDGAGAGNVLGGWFAAIRIAGSNNVVQGNLIGTDATGTQARSIQNYGLTIWGQNNLIGGLTPGARNVIAASSSGVVVTDSGATANTIQGNFIGTDITGTNALPNGNSGISIEYASANLVGGPAPGARNVISGNGGYGLGIGSDGATSNVVQGNYLGLASDGVTPLPNFGGIRITSQSGSLIGGTATGCGNWIAHNSRYGIGIVGDGATNNALLGNHIFANGWQGIDLGEDGLNANDPNDADEGPNHYQNSPELTSARLSSGAVTVRYRVNSAPANAAYPFTVEFYLADSFAGGQGKTLLQRHTFDTPQTFTNISFVPLAAVSEGDWIVGTATDANGNTSEFSVTTAVTVNHRPVVLTAIPDQISVYGSSFNYTIPAETFSDPDALDTLSYAATGLPPGVTFTAATRLISGTPTQSGTFTVTVTATDDGLPPLSTNDVFDIVVMKGALVVTADNKSRLPNQENPTLTGTLVGLVNGDAISATFQTTATMVSPPGTYPIVPLLNDPNNRLPQYTVTTNAGTLTVVDCSLLRVNNASLPDATRGVAYSVTLTAANGVAPYAYAVSGGALPHNLTLAANGLLSGTPGTLGTFAFAITATDALGCTVSSNYSVTVGCPSISLAPTSLLGASLNTAYSQALSASGGSAPYTYGVTGGSLPSGLVLSGAGALTGTPTASGNFNFVVTATDAGGCTGSRNYSLVVEAPVYEGFAYADGVPLAGQNGGSGFSNGWSGASSFVVVPGSFPAGGGPTSGGHLMAGDGTVTRRLLVPLGTPGTTRYLSVSIPVVFAGFSNDRFGLLLNGTTGTGLFVGKPAAGVNNWSLENEAGGSRVTGPSIGPGAYLVLKCEFFAGNDRFTLYVNPTAGQPEPATGTIKFNSDAGTITNIAFTASNTFAQDSFDELRVSSTFAGALPSCPAITVNPSSLPAASLGAAYAQNLTASGGVVPYAFSLSAGFLPPGLMLSAAGEISGTPTTSGNYSFTVQARDANGCSGTRSYTLNVPCPTIGLSPATLPEAGRGTPYSQMLSASGGTGPYTFTLAFGALPNGITLSTAGLISGMATNYGIYSFGVFANDAVGCSGLKSYVIEVQPNRWVGDGGANLWNLTAPNWRHGLFLNDEDVAFDDTGSNNVPVDIAIQVHPASVLVNATQAYTFSGSGGITGTGSLAKAGSGDLILTTSNSFSGATRVSDGSVTLRHNRALGTAAGGTVVDGTNASVRLEGNGLSIAEPLTIDIPDSFDSSGTNGVLINVGQSNAWSGSITLNRANIDGPAAIRSWAGRLTLNSPTPIAGPGNLKMGGDGEVVIESGIGSTVASLRASGSGIVRLLGTNASGGLINVVGGKVVAVPRALGSSPILAQLDGAFELDSGGNLTVDNSITLRGGKLRVAGGTITWAGAAYVDDSYGGAIETATATDRLVMNGPFRHDGAFCCGTLTIGGLGTVVLNQGLTPLQNGFIGYWQVNESTLVLNHINALNQAGTVNIGYGASIRTGVDGGGSFAYFLGVANGTFRPGRGTLGSGVSNYFGVLRLGQLTVAPGSNLLAGSTADLGFGEGQLFTNATLSVDNQGSVNARVTVLGQIRQDFGDPLSLTKAGSGTLVLVGDNTYQGDTVVSNGTLRVSNPMGSATGPGSLMVNDHATLAGAGRIAGFVTIGSGGTLAPGDSIGTLTISNRLVLEAGSTNSVEVNLSTLTNDRIVGLSNVTYGGTLRLTRLGAAPYANGNVIKLFDATTYSGSFARIEPPAPAAGLQWNTSTMNSDGTLRVMMAVTPVPFALTNMTVLPDGAFQFSFGNTPDAVFTVLAATNIALPVTNWTVLGPVTQISPGHFQFTDTQASNSPAKFYQVRSP